MSDNNTNPEKPAADNHWPDGTPTHWPKTQSPTPIQHVSIGHDGRLTTVYPNGQAFTDPTPRVHVGCPGGRECLGPRESVRISGCQRDAHPPASIDVVVHGESGEAMDLPPGIVWRPAGKCPCRDGLQESADGGLELCEDCDGTGWTAESNPGTGAGTGRDEQIAVPCPRGCPEPPDDDAADMELLGLAMDDQRESMPADDFPEHVRYRLQALTEQGMVKQVAGGYAATYLGAFHHEALASANRVWDEMTHASQGDDPTTAEIAAAIARGEMTLGLTELAHVTDGDLLRAIREETADTGEGAAMELCEEATRRGLLTWEDGEEGESDTGVLTPKGHAALATAAQGVDDEQGEDPRW